jgi:hypothetical protein
MQLQWTEPINVMLFMYITVNSEQLQQAVCKNPVAAETSKELIFVLISSSHYTERGESKSTKRKLQITIQPEGVVPLQRVDLSGPMYTTDKHFLHEWL